MGYMRGEGRLTTQFFRTQYYKTTILRAETSTTLLRQVGYIAFHDVKRVLCDIDFGIRKRTSLFYHVSVFKDKTMITDGIDSFGDAGMNRIWRNAELCVTL